MFNFGRWNQASSTHQQNNRCNKMSNNVEKYSFTVRADLRAALREFCTLGVQTLSWCLGSLHFKWVGGFLASNSITHPRTFSEQSRLQDETSEGSKVYNFFFFLSLLICYLTAEHGEGRPMNFIIINNILLYPLRAGMPRRPSIRPMPLALMVSRLYKGILWWSVSHQLLVCPLFS